MGQQGEDVDLHQRSRLAFGHEAGSDDDPAFLQIDRTDAVLDHGKGDPALELEHVVRHARCHVLHSAEYAASLVLHDQPTSWYT